MTTSLVRNQNVANPFLPRRWSPMLDSGTDRMYRTSPIKTGQICVWAENYPTTHGGYDRRGSTVRWAQIPAERPCVPGYHYYSESLAAVHSRARFDSIREYQELHFMT